MLTLAFRRNSKSENAVGNCGSNDEALRGLTGQTAKGTSSPSDGCDLELERLDHPIQTLTLHPSTTTGLVYIDATTWMDGKELFVLDLRSKLRNGNQALTLHSTRSNCPSNGSQHHDSVAAEAVSMMTRSEDRLLAFVPVGKIRASHRVSVLTLQGLVFSPTRPLLLR